MRTDTGSGSKLFQIFSLVQELIETCLGRVENEDLTKAIWVKILSCSSFEDRYTAVLLNTMNQYLLKDKSIYMTPIYWITLRDFLGSEDPYI